jgi:hypothetical protein
VAENGDLVLGRRSDRSRAGVVMMERLWVIQSWSWKRLAKRHGRNWSLVAVGVVGRDDDNVLVDSSRSEVLENLEVLLALLLESLALAAAVMLDTDGSKEWLEMFVEVLVADAEVPVEEEEELLLHEVDLSDREAEVVVAADERIPGPVLVLWGAVVQVLCSKDERGQEDSVSCAAHALCDLGESLAQTVQVDERGHEGWDLDMRAVDDAGNEDIESRNSVLSRAVGRLWSARRRKLSLDDVVLESRVAADNLTGLAGQVGDHSWSDRLVNEVREGISILLRERDIAERHCECLVEGVLREKKRRSSNSSSSCCSSE